ncbi:DUF2975 domain-containing protein [Stakelama sp. CBK3Z-3]|uniref:DUF2975 domain-containing protein n=1 Tax=Stakelama flava TaxID=2860338 RepID=A0ABS6XMC0_9SPHN|nr:DUF2975 domain-containing protein [Stakelama flava]MBW4331345.1 DUF2975 domain-containing protein [Stakelama flava]
MLRFTRTILTGLNYANWIFVVLFAIAAIALLANPAQVAEILRQAFGVEAGRARVICAAIAGLVVPAGFAAHLIFTRLIAILDAARAGEPFAMVNADRLRTVAWAMLAIQILDLCAGALAITLSKISDEYFGWSFGLSGWLAVLLLFVLARIFRIGAAMQEDLVGTV